MASVKGERFRNALAWKGSSLEMWANGVRFDPWVKVRDPSSRVLAQARYLIVVGEPRPGEAAGVTVPLHSGLLEFRVFDAFDGWRQVAHVGSVAAERAFYGTGQEIAVTLRSSIDGTATFALAGMAANVPMEEVDDGVYVGSVVVPAELKLSVDSAAFPPSSTPCAPTSRAAVLTAPDRSTPLLTAPGCSPPDLLPYPPASSAPPVIAYVREVTGDVKRET